MKQARVKKLATSRIKKGYPMIVEQDFIRSPEVTEGQLVELSDETGKYLATAYFGREKRAIGWIISKNKGNVLDAGYFVSLFEKAKTLRVPFLKDETTTAFRLFNGEGDGLGGFTVDYYAGYAVFNWYNQGIYSYRSVILEVFLQIFPEIKGIYEKKRYRTTHEETDFVTGEQAPDPLLVLENGIRYAVHLDDGLMTGIFLDQRHVRRTLMEEYAAGHSVLNLFSYTGAFSVAASMGGAVKTVSVDVANRSRKKTEEQFDVNGLPTEDHEIRVMDVFQYIQYGLRHKLQFDVIVSDPPTFARTKKRTFSVEQDYGELIKQLIDLTSPDGVLVLSLNTWTISREEFLDIIRSAFADKQQAFEIEAEFGVPADFPVKEEYPEGNYLKVFFVRKK